jgi:hypothetical protein
VCVILSSLCCLPMFIFGGWLLILWVAIQIRRSVYLEYSYLTVGIAFLSLGVVALFCVVYAAKKRGGWGGLYVVPVIAGLWSMVVIPNIVPYDVKSLHHIRNLTDELDSFSKQHGRFPDHETALPAEVLKEPSPYYQNGRQLPFRTVLVPNATGPFLDSPGADPGVIFYAVSADQQEVWLTGTEIRFPHRPVGGHAQFIRFLSLDGDTRVRHLHAGHEAVPVSREIQK